MKETTNPEPVSKNNKQEPEKKTNNSIDQTVTEPSITHLSDNAKSDYALIQFAIKGDQKAYEKLMKRYRDSIYYMLLKMVKNTDDAEDLTIEAFEKAFKNIEKYSPKYAFSTWLFKIASNNCIDFIRKKKGITVSIEKTNDKGESYEPAIIDKSPTPEAAYIKEQKAQILRDTVKTLKPQYRRLIELRYFKEFSYTEISEELDLPLGTVKAQLFRSRELLMNILSKKKDHM